MQRTCEKFLLVVFCAYLAVASSSAVNSPHVTDKGSIDQRGSFHNRRTVLHIVDITTSTADDDSKSAITYRPINHAPTGFLKEDDGDSSLLEITLDGFRIGDSLLLMSTPSRDSCRENSSSHPAWKIDTSVSGEKFRLKINHAASLAGKTLFLCVRSGESGELRHLGDRSRFRVGG